MKYVLLLLFLVVGCSPQKQTVISTKNVVITPAPELYNCPMIQEFPDWKTLDDRQVAATIVQMYKNNVACFNSNDAIRKFLEDAKKRVDQ